MFSVSGVLGRAITRIFVSGSTSSSREMGSTWSKSAEGRPLRLRPVILAAPMPRSRWATLVPMLPVPRMVNSLSRMERMGSWRDQLCWRTTASYSGIRRSSMRVTMTTCSAMVTP